MDSQARRAREEMKKLPLDEKLKNFWYYYKIHCIVLLFAVLVLIWAAVQCANTIHYDMEISYFGNTYIDEQRVTQLEEALKKHTVDINGDEVINVSLMQRVGDLTKEYIDRESSAALEKMRVEIATNECPAYIVDETFKEIFQNTADEAVHEIIDLSKVPYISSILGLSPQKTLYWIMMVEYETAKDDAALSAERSCALSFTEFLKQSAE